MDYPKYINSLKNYHLSDNSIWLRKLKLLSTIPSTSILATMDVNSLYTNIGHEEVASACYKKLEPRAKKTVPSNSLKNCILLILKSNIFWFCNTFDKQKRGQHWVPQWLLIMQTYLWTCLKDLFLMTSKKNWKDQYSCVLSITYFSFGEKVKTH